MRSGLLGAMPGDVPLQGGFDDVGHLVAALLHECEGFVPHGSDADGADGRLSSCGSSCHAKNVTQKFGPSSCAGLPAMSFLYYKKAAQAGRTEMTGYKVKGTTGDVDTCAFGHTGLKKTVALAVLDADGNEGEVIYLGTDCAARVMRTSEAKVRNAAAAADGERAAKVVRAREILDTYAPVEDADARTKAGLYFGRNPHMRTLVSARDEIAGMLAWARDVLGT